MPELPEVESVLQCLTSGELSLVGRTVQQVKILRNSVIDGDRERFLQTVTGSRFQAVKRHGKYLFFMLSPAGDADTFWFAVHLRMTGRLYLAPAAQAMARHTRFALMLDKSMALRFDDSRCFGRVWLLDTPDTVIRGLGADGLAINRLEFLDGIRKSGRQLKPLLLDQSFLAGIGNIYADESLFRARLHPLQKGCNLTPDEAERLYRAVKGVLRQAVDAKGANIDGVFEAGSFPVAVYGRGGKPCINCGAEIRKERYGQRGTHFCPDCQPFNRER